MHALSSRRPLRRWSSHCRPHLPLRPATLVATHAAADEAPPARAAGTPGPSEVRRGPLLPLQRLRRGRATAQARCALRCQRTRSASRRCGEPGRQGTPSALLRRRQAPAGRPSGRTCSCARGRRHRRGLERRRQQLCRRPAGPAAGRSGPRSWRPAVAVQTAAVPAAAVAAAAAAAAAAPKGPLPASNRSSNSGRSSSSSSGSRSRAWRPSSWSGC